ALTSGWAAALTSGWAAAPRTLCVPCGPSFRLKRSPCPSLQRGLLRPHLARQPIRDAKATCGVARSMAAVDGGCGGAGGGSSAHLGRAKGEEARAVGVSLPFTYQGSVHGPQMLFRVLEGAPQLVPRS